MGKSKDLYIELCRVEMPAAFYEANEQYFKDNDCKLKSDYAVNRSLEKHPDRQRLLDDMKEAKARLNELEYEIRYKRQIKE